MEELNKACGFSEHDKKENCSRLVLEKLEKLNSDKSRNGIVKRLYHGSGDIVEFPEIRKTRYAKDFSWGFYCTKNYEQARRWAVRRSERSVINIYSYTENSELHILKFEEMSDEWLDFIARCRAGYIHDYDIVEGPMADDTIWNFVNEYLNGNISKSVFWEYAKFKHPTHQISFHTLKALDCLRFEESIKLYE